MKIKAFFCIILVSSILEISYYYLLHKYKFTWSGDTSCFTICTHMVFNLNISGLELIQGLWVFLFHSPGLSHDYWFSPSLTGLLGFPTLLVFFDT